MLEVYFSNLSHKKRNKKLRFNNNNSEFLYLLNLRSCLGRDLQETAQIKIVINAKNV